MNRARKTSSGRMANVSTALARLQLGLSELYGPAVPRVVLYGSQARGEARPDSDVDVLLVYTHQITPGKEISSLSALLAGINLDTGILLAVMPVQKADYEHATAPFWRNVRREGVPFERFQSLASEG